MNPVIVDLLVVVLIMMCVTTNFGGMLVGAVTVYPNNNNNNNNRINHDLNDDDHYENVFIQQDVFPQLLVRKKKQQQKTMNDHLYIWPFPPHHNNTTNNNNNTDNNNSNSTNNNNNNNNTNDKVCFDASSSCERCNSYYTCHYCAHTNTCHAIGSIYGCMIGSTCASVNPPKPKPNIDPNDTASGCSMHTNCHNCTTSSTLCHWCAHDNRCHVLGSVYGCITGVDCYDNNHCQRLLPERIIPSRSSDDHTTNHTTMNSTDMNHTIGTLPLIIIISLSTILFCCTTFCCCIMNCIKGAYDDLAYTTTTTTTSNNTTNPILDNDTAYLFIENYEDSINNNQNDDADADANRSSSECNRNEPIVISNEHDEEDQEGVDDGLATSDEQDVGTSNASEQEPLLPQIASTTPTTTIEETTTGGTITDEYIQMVDGEDGTSLLPNPNCRRNTSTNATRSGSHVRRRRRQQRGLPPTRRRFTAMNRLYTTCMVCYTCNLLLIGMGTYLSITYFPQKPIYNICNDSVAWKSLMDSMTSFTATAEFEILASIYNPNVFDIALDVGKGNFAHDNTIVGTYEIPPTLIASQAITDILIVAKFTPEKWQALSITAEYYHGTLVMSVNADATIRIPFLFDYTISTSLQDITVHVNELSDRHLCSCPYNTK